MYINPFWAGVVTTIFVELLAMIIFWNIVRKKERRRGVMRKLARNVAKVNMKKKGMVQFCKHSGNNKSYFAQHCREYVR